MCILDYYFEFFIREITYLHLSFCFWGVGLLFHLEHIPVSLHFVCLFVFVSMNQMKQLPFLI